MRCALTSAIAAATPPRSSSGRRGAGAASGAGGGDARSPPLPFAVRGAAARAAGRGPGGRSRVDRAALEERAPLGRDGLGVLEVLLEDRRSRTRRSGRRRPSVLLFCSRAHASLPEPHAQKSGRSVTTAMTIAEQPADAGDRDGGRGQLLVAPADAGGDEREHDRGDADPDRPHLEVRPGDAQVEVRSTPRTARKIAVADISPASVVEPLAAGVGRGVAHRGTSPGRPAPGATRRRAVRAAAGPARAEPREPPAWLRVDSGAGRAQRRLERLRLGADRPPDDAAEVDHRDLEDDEHPDQLPGHWAILGNFSHSASPRPSVAPGGEQAENDGPAGEEQPVARPPEVALGRAPQHVAELAGRNERRDRCDRIGQMRRRRPERRRRTRARGRGCSRPAARLAATPSSRARSRAARTGGCRAASATASATQRRGRRWASVVASAAATTSAGRGEAEERRPRARGPRSARARGAAACGGTAPRATRARRRCRRRTGRTRRRGRRSRRTTRAGASGRRPTRGATKSRKKSAGNASVGTLNAG